MSILYLLIIIDILGLAVAQLLFKKGVTLIGPSDFSFVQVGYLFLSISKNVYILAGAVLAAISFLLWLFILSKINLSIIYPISAGLVLSLVTLGALVFLKENLHWIQIVGIVVIIIGIFLIHQKV